MVLSIGIIFAKNANFLQKKNACISKIKGTKKHIL